MNWKNKGVPESKIIWGYTDNIRLGIMRRINEPNKNLSNYAFLKCKINI